MRIFRKLLRILTTTLPIRGRYRIADKLGAIISPVEPEKIDIYGLQFPIDHSVQTYRFIYYGLYEEFFVRFLKRIIRPGDIIIEPGVNVGYITAVLSGLAGPKGKVIALEPSRICFTKIEKYLSRSNIILLNKALGERNKIAQFVDKKIVISHGYSSLADFALRDPDDEVYDISVTTVDRLMEENQIQKIRLLKLDIEGAELSAIKGAENALNTHAIDYILVETTFIEQNNQINKQLHDILSNRGYLPHLLERNRIRPVTFLDLKDCRHDIIWTLENNGKGY